MTAEIPLLQRELVKFKQTCPVITGPGDDCAVLSPSSTGMVRLLAVDQVISDIHFTLNTPPEAVAVKLLRRNLSDIAAMGGIPETAVKTIALKLESEESEDIWLTRFFDGLSKEAARWNIPICGGDLSRLPHQGIVTTLSILGTVPEGECVLRSGASPGDYLGVTGLFGNSFLSGHHLNFLPQVDVGRFLAQHHRVHAMMDVSDGLLMDLGRLCKASGCGASLTLSAIPLRLGADIAAALSDGEDYELLFAVPSDTVESLTALWPFSDIPLTWIGRITESASITDENGTLLTATGWDPFA